MRIADVISRRRVIAGVGALTAVLILSAGRLEAQQPIGALLLANTGWGAVAFGRIDRFGSYEQTYVVPANSSSEVLGATHIVNTTNGFLIYSRHTGRAQVMSLANNGYPMLGSSYWFSPGWQHIVGIGNFLLFYRSDGAAAIGHITPEGEYVEKQNGGPGWFGYWTHVTATDNHFFFFNAFSGWAAVGEIHPAGFFITTQVIPPYTMPLPTTASYVASVGQYVLLYHQLTGATTVAYIDRHGHAEVTDLATLPAGYHILARHAGYFILHASNLDSATIGYIDDEGHFFITQTLTTGTGVSRIASTGEHLLFYWWSSSTGLVGSIGRDGLFHETASNVGLPPFISHLVSTRR